MSNSKLAKEVVYEMVKVAGDLEIIGSKLDTGTDASYDYVAPFRELLKMIESGMSREEIIEEVEQYRGFYEHHIFDMAYETYIQLTK